LNSARTRPVGCCWGRIVACLIWRELLGSRGGQSSTAGAPACSGLLKFGSNSTSGVLLGSNRCTLDLAGAPKVSCWAVQQRRRPRMLTFGSNLTGGVLVGSNVGTFELARTAVVSCRAAQCCGRPRKLKFGSNSTGGGAVGMELWQARLGATSRGLVLGRPVPPAPAQAQIRIEFDRWALLGWNGGKLDLARPPEVSCWAVLCRRRPRKLKFGSKQIVGWLPGSNRGTLDLVRAPVTSCLVV